MTFALSLLLQAAAPAFADQPTSQPYNQDGLTGTTKTTTNADTNTTTSTTTASGKDSAGQWVDRTIKVTTTGKPVTSQKTVQVDVIYADDPKTHQKGKKESTITDTTINSNYNDAGGYSQTHDQKQEAGNATVLIHEENTCDASGAILSGTRTITYLNPDGSKKEEKKQTYKSGSWEDVALAPEPIANMSTSMVAQVEPEPGMSGNIGDGSNAALPPAAGAESQIVFQVGTPDREQGAGGVLILTENDKGQKKVFRATPSADGLVVLGGTILAGLKTVSLLKDIDGHGEPEIASTCTIGNPAHIPGTDPVANVPSGGPAITEMPSSMQPGEIIKGHITRVDPGSTYFLIDGVRVQPLGASDDSVSLKIPDNATFGHRIFQIVSGGKTGNEVRASVVRIYADPVPASEPGVEQLVTLHVDGMQAGDHGVIYCEIGGAATMADGGSTAALAVGSDGTAHLHIRGIRAGQALLRFHLQVASPDFSA